MVGVVREVRAAVEAANRVQQVARPTVLLVTLDLKNAFNTARWDDIQGVLGRGSDFRGKGGSYRQTPSNGVTRRHNPRGLC